MINCQNQEFVFAVLSLLIPLLMVVLSKCKMTSMFLFSMSPKAITILMTWPYWNVFQFKKQESIVSVSMRYMMVSCRNTLADTSTQYILQRVSLHNFIASRCTLLRFFLSVSSLIHSAVEPVNGGICVFCVFTVDTTAKGCVVKLSSDQVTLSFNVSRQSKNDVVLQECFEVSQSGSYHVLVSEIQPDGSEGYHTLELPPITVVLDSDTTAEQINGGFNLTHVAIMLYFLTGTSTVTGLSAVLSLTLLGLIIAVLIAFILYFKRRLAIRSKTSGKLYKQENSLRPLLADSSCYCVFLVTTHKMNKT